MTIIQIDTVGNRPFDRTETRLNEALARGHEIRLGHELTGYRVGSAAEGSVSLHRTCCKN